MIGVQAPANLNARRERSLEAWDGKSDKPREGRDAGNLDSPETEAELLKVGLNPVCQGITFAPRQRTWKKLHNLRIAVQSCERKSVAWQPTPEM